VGRRNVGNGELGVRNLDGNVSRVSLGMESNIYFFETGKHRGQQFGPGRAVASRLATIARHKPTRAREHSLVHRPAHRNLPQDVIAGFNLHLGHLENGGGRLRIGTYLVSDGGLARAWVTDAEKRVKRPRRVVDEIRTVTRVYFSCGFHVVGRPSSPTRVYAIGKSFFLHFSLIF
jgi:hypothetical protein